MLIRYQRCLGVKLEGFPLNTWGMPLCLGLPKKSRWDSVVERVERKLSSWKGRYLLMGGRLILIKSVLSSIRIYFLPASDVLRVFCEELKRDNMTFCGMILLTKKLSLG